MKRREETSELSVFRIGSQIQEFAGVTEGTNEGCPASHPHPILVQGNAKERKWDEMMVCCPFPHVHLLLSLSRASGKSGLVKGMNGDHSLRSLTSLSLMSSLLHLFALVTRWEDRNERWREVESVREWEMAGPKGKKWTRTHLLSHHSLPHSSLRLSTWLLPLTAYVPILILRQHVNANEITASGL